MFARSLHWSPQQTVLVWVLVASVAAGVWYAVFYAAAHDEWQAADNKLAAALSDLQARHAVQAGVRRHAVQQDRDEAALAEQFRTVPGGDGHGDDALFVVPALAEASGLQIQLWRPLPEELDGPLVWAPVEVEARGGWAALHELLRHIGEQPQVIAVDRLNARAIDDDALVWRFTVSVARLTRREGT